MTVLIVFRGWLWIFLIMRLWWFVLPLSGLGVGDGRGNHLFGVWLGWH
jgi:hypothetical protein